MKELATIKEALEFIASGCLVPPDGGTPSIADASKSAKEALAALSALQARRESEELVNDLWLYECSNCDFVSKTRRVPTSPACPFCGSAMVSEVAYVSRRQVRAAIAAVKGE